MRILLILLSLLINSAIWILNRFGFGGTALPGLWVEKYAPSLVRQYAKFYDKVIFVTGTNGKTTTQLTIHNILDKAGKYVVCNSSGSNMMRGIASVLLASGVPSKSKSTHSILLCEVEEATMPIVTQYIQPDYIVMTNLFRDQLDAYGELDKTAQYLRTSCLNCPNSIIIANIDDPQLAMILQSVPNSKTLFSLGTYAKDFPYEGKIPADAVKSNITVVNIIVNDDLSTRSRLIDMSNDSQLDLTFIPPGIYNVYNALAAYATAKDLGVSQDQIIDGIQTTKSPFGRGEVVQIPKEDGNISIHILLVKNPAGFSKVWEMVSHLTEPIDIVLGLNDNIADGKDVSWIWDITFENSPSINSIRNIHFTGTRAQDMALRFKYADINVMNKYISNNIDKCLTDVIQKGDHNRHCYMLLTYTTTNEMRESLKKFVTISKFTT